MYTAKEKGFCTMLSVLRNTVPTPVVRDLEIIVDMWELADELSDLAQALDDAAEETEYIIRGAVEDKWLDRYTADYTPYAKVKHDLIQAKQQVREMRRLFSREHKMFDY